MFQNWTVKNLHYVLITKVTKTSYRNRKFMKLEIVCKQKDSNFDDEI